MNHFWFDAYESPRVFIAFISQIQQGLRKNLHQRAVQQLVTASPAPCGVQNSWVYPRASQIPRRTIDTNFLLSIYRTFKNRFAVQQHVVRAFQTTSQLLEVVKVPPFADSVSEGDVKWVKKNKQFDLLFLINKMFSDSKRKSAMPSQLMRLWWKSKLIRQPLVFHHRLTVSSRRFSLRTATPWSRDNSCSDWRWREKHRKQQQPRRQNQPLPHHHHLQKQRKLQDQR